MSAAELGSWWPWLLLLAGALVTYVWRAIGVAVSGRIAPDGALFEWVSAVAYALLAALIARMIIEPMGPLQQTPLIDRLAGVALALGAFVLSRRNLLAGVGTGVAALVLLTYLRQ
jgi:branched-subunit amino acid transport protein